jgi:hypothetical protein
MRLATMLRVAQGLNVQPTQVTTAGSSESETPPGKTRRRCFLGEQGFSSL